MEQSSEKNETLQFSSISPVLSNSLLANGELSAILKKVPKTEGFYG